MTENNYQTANYVKNVVKWYQLPTMEIGDIVLLGTENEKFSWTSSKVIQWLQYFFSGFKSRTIYSHAALCIDDGLFIEAKGPYRVVYSTYDDLFKIKRGSPKKKYAKHYRNNSLSEHDKSLITERGLYYVGTPYSKINKQLLDYSLSILPFRGDTQKRAHSIEDESGSFCSSLVVDILEPIIDMNRKPVLSVRKNSKYVLPLHIEQKMAKGERWHCVDADYEYLKGDNIYARAYRTLGKVHKKYYKAKQKSLKVTQGFFTVKDYYQTIPLWFRMHIYHLLNTGTAKGEIEYLALKSLTELLEKEK